MLELGWVVPLNLPVALGIEPRNDAILLVVLDESIPKNAKKSERLARLNDLHEIDPSKISDYISGDCAARTSNCSTTRSTTVASIITSGSYCNCRRINFLWSNIGDGALAVLLLR